MTDTPADTVSIDVYVPVAVSYQVTDLHALDAARQAVLDGADPGLATEAARQAVLDGGEADFEGSPFQETSATNNVWGPWKPEPEEDIDDSYEWQRDVALTVRAVDDVDRAFKALAGLEALYRSHSLHDPEASTSGADQCEALYELLGSLGFPVP